ncbi:MAG: hypothetical protein OSA51_04300 [Octadecabacter sp.]|nr:hypothetical protein [Octadecabacter sp.]
MKYAALILTVGLLSGCDGMSGQTLPDGITASDVALFKAAVTEAGCIIRTNAETVPIAVLTGFDRDKLVTVIQYLTLAGESEPTANGFQLTSGICANA